MLSEHYCSAVTIGATRRGFAQSGSTPLGLMRSQWVGLLIVQHDVEQRAVHLQATVVMYEAQFPEPVHEKAHA
jgi:hypothetical protein